MSIEKKAMTRTSIHIYRDDLEMIQGTNINLSKMLRPIIENVAEGIREGRKGNEHDS